MKKTPIVFILLFFVGIALSFFLQNRDRNRPSRESDPDRMPMRIVCAAPSVTEFVFALGMGDKIVGVSDFAHWPPEAREKEKIGGLVNPNMERITAMNPDLIIGQGEIALLSAYCRQKNIPYLQVTMRNIEVIYDEVMQIGRALGCEDRAMVFVQECRDGFDAIQQRASRKEPKKVLLCISRKKGMVANILTTGRGTFLNEIVAIAGGRNIFDDLETDYPQISKESVLMRAPDYILELRPVSPFESSIDASILDDWKQMPLIPAVASGTVFLVTEDYMVIPGPRMIQAAQRVYEILHSGE
jgi:iron complex transport system substrate-binding protein